MDFFMANIIYRNILNTDHEKIISLIIKTWPFKDNIHSKNNLNTFARFMFTGSLMDSSYGMVALTDDQIVGFIMGSVKKGKKRFLRFGPIVQALRCLTSFFFMNRIDRNNIFEYLKVPGIYKEMKNKGKWDGEIVFFAVEDKYRGLGIGKNLMKGLENYFSEIAANKVNVFTDSDSNYGFYDSQDYKLINEKEFTFNMIPDPKTLKMFLYEREYF